MADDLGEKTEEATPRRQQEAREEGNVAKSQDLAGALLLITVTVGLWLVSSTMFTKGAGLLQRTLDGGFLGDPLTIDGLWPLLTDLAVGAVIVLVPVLAIAWLAGAGAHLLQTGWLFSPQALRPKFGKLNPLEGAKRIFGLSGLVKVSLDALKVAIVVAVVIATMLQKGEQIICLPQLTAIESALTIGLMMLDLGLRVGAVLLLLGVIDFAYQRWRHSRDLRMTRQQVKEELKQTDGDPEVRRRRMRMQQQIAMQRVSAAVPRADVVVTNPEHLAIAIAYDADEMAAPTVVAKGADHLALRIRQIALHHGIPIVERKPLARALYKSVEVNQQVPPDFYKAVAEVLAYVYRLSGKEAVR